MRVADLNWLGEDQREVAVKVRSLAPPVPAVIEDGGWVRFEQSEYGVAPGQAAVFYDDARVLGGGVIAETARVEQPLAA
jgi:tRNA-specific 2-thiouridylase